MTGDPPYYRYNYSTTSTAINNYIDGSYDMWGNVRVQPTYDNSAEVYSLKAKLANLEDLFFRKVVSKCPACGQWGAALCECKHCGHPVDLGEKP